MDTETKVRLLRLSQPLNRSANPEAIDRYFAGVVDGKGPDELERLVIDTNCIELMDLFAGAVPKARDNINDLILILQVMQQ